MADTINKVILVGNLGADVKFHRFDEENSIARFSVATTENYTNKETGEKHAHTDWHNVVVKNKTAEHCEKYLSKGSKVFVEGKLRTRSWESNGVTKYTTEVICDKIEFWSSTKKENNPQNG